MSVYSEFAVTYQSDKVIRSSAGSQDPRLPTVRSLHGLLCRLSAGSVFCFGFAFCLSGSRAVPAQGGDESVGALPVGVPDTRISSDASHFSALGDPVTGLSEKMRFFKKLFLGRVKGPVSFSFSFFLFFFVESLKESFSGVLLHYNSSLTERPRTQSVFRSSFCLAW